MITKNSIIYSLVTDRFDNDDGTLANVRNQENYADLLKGSVGGTFRGIERHIPYFSELGITHVMSSPPERCVEGDYHGYSVTHPLEINPHFGTASDLKRLSASLAESGINHVLDYVPLTISTQSRLFQEKSQTPEGREWFIFREMLTHPDYGEEAQRLAARQDCGESEFFHFFCDPNLPYFNLANRDVVKWHINRVSELVNEYGYSDVRLDLGFYMPESTMKRFRDEIKKKTRREVSVIVENWPHPIQEFNGGECFGLCDGEVNLKGTILLNNWGAEPHLIGGSDIDENRGGISDHFYRTKGKADKGYTFITGIDNHDLPRFKGDSLEQKMAATLQFTLPNFTPMIYYGNEWSMPNEGDDPFAPGRGVMDFSNLSLFEFYKNLCHFRRNSDFSNARMNNFRVNDINKGETPENQLVTYDLYLPNNDKSYHIIINREDREKPIKYHELFNGDGFFNWNVLTQSCVEQDGEFLVLEPKTSYLLERRERK